MASPMRKPRVPQKTLYARSTRGGRVLPVACAGDHFCALFGGHGLLATTAPLRRGVSEGGASALATGSGAAGTRGDVRRGFGLAAGFGSGTAAGTGGGGNSVIVAVSGVDSGSREGSSGHSVNARCTTSERTSATASARRVRAIAFDCARRSEMESSVGAEADAIPMSRAVTAPGDTTDAARRIQTLNVDPAALDRKPPLAIPSYDLRQEDVLDGEHARGEAALVVAIAHRHRTLRDDRPDVDFGCHEVHGAAVHADAVGQRAAMRVQAGIGGQQRRMDVDHAPSVTRNESRRRARA